MIAKLLNTEYSNICVYMGVCGGFSFGGLLFPGDQTFVEAV